MTTEAEALAEITAGLAKAVGSDCGLGKKVKFDFGSAGVVMIDATSVPNVVCNADEAADSRFARRFKTSCSCPRASSIPPQHSCRAA